MRLVAIGKLGNGPEADLFDEYAKRLKPPLLVTEIPEARAATPAERRRREAAAILAALGDETPAIALDSAGALHDSGTFARLITPKTTFLIGGPDGLDNAVLAHAPHHLAFGPQTWPHKLVRIMLTEQIYRAQAIGRGHPYHKAFRAKA